MCAPHLRICANYWFYLRFYCSADRRESVPWDVIDSRRRRAQAFGSTPHGQMPNVAARIIGRHPSRWGSVPPMVGAPPTMPLRGASVGAVPTGDYLRLARGCAVR